MGFPAWHYTEGLNLYLKRWYFLLAWVNHFFSLPLLLPTLFAPWKRLTDEDQSPGFNPERFFRQLTFNLISRSIGAIVRLFLLLFGLLTLFPVFFLGLIGLAVWVMFPVIGIPYYLTGDRDHRRTYRKILRRLSLGEGIDPVKTVFDSLPGKFVLAKLNTDLSTLSAAADITAWKFSDFVPGRFEPFISGLIDSGIWQEEKLKTAGIDFTDLRLAARWWDTVYSVREDDEDESFHLSQPGLGLELLFGYTPQLNRYSTDLAKPQDFSHHLIGREELVARIERELTGGTNVVLIGQPGVGRKTVMLEFARRAMAGELGSQLLYKRVLEFDYNFIMSESMDISQKKVNLDWVLKEARDAGNVILVIRDLHRLVHSDVEGIDFTDLFEKYLSDRKLKIVTIVSPAEYERFLLPNARLRRYFQTIEVQPVSKDDAMLILFQFASRQEQVRRLSFSVRTLRTILEGADNYITDTPFPEKSLELLDHVVEYMAKKRSVISSPDDVNQVISEQTGISIARLTESEKALLADLETILHRTLVGQDHAVRLIAQSLRSRTVGTKSPDRPIGSFLFLGPTGVGKTQTAKTLAKAYYGSDKYLLRFDMAEYAGSEGISRLIGSVEANRPGILTSAIRKHPASLLLLDEIEKAPREIYNLFLTLLDEGSITDASGRQISCRHLFVIATSNAGAIRIRDLVNSGTTPEELQKDIVDYVQKQGLFSPEFLNRFDGVVVFHPLSEPELVVIARLMLEDVKKNLSAKNITLEITEDVCAKLAKEGYQPDNGARAMRRIVDLDIGDTIGQAILRDTLKSGDHFRLEPKSGLSEYGIKKTK